MYARANITTKFSKIINFNHNSIIEKMEMINYNGLSLIRFGKWHTTSLSIRTPPKPLNLLITSWLKNLEVSGVFMAGRNKASIK